MWFETVPELGADGNSRLEGLVPLGDVLLTIGPLADYITIAIGGRELFKVLRSVRRSSPAEDAISVEVRTSKGRASISVDHVDKGTVEGIQRLIRSLSE